MTLARRVTAVVALVAVLVGSGLAQGGGSYRDYHLPRTHYANNGLYFGLATVHQTIGGEFDGETILYGWEQVIAVPKIRGGLGYGIVFGGRSSHFGVEFAYLRSQHDASWLDSETNADYNAVNVDGKIYLLAATSLQMHLSAGVGFMWLNVDDAAIYHGEIGDPRFQGFGINVGGGALCYVSRRVGFGVNAAYRKLSFGEVAGGAFGDIEGGLDASGFCVSVGVTCNIREE